MWLYYNLIPGSLSNTKYGITDVSYAKIHETTPTLLKVSGPRLLEDAKELVDMYMKDKETKNETPNVDYTVKYLSRDTLIKKKLVKVKTYDI